MAHNMFITRGKRFENSKRSSAVENIHYDTYDTLRVYLWAREPAWGIKKKIDRLIDDGLKYSSYTVVFFWGVFFPPV